MIRQLWPKKGKRRFTMKLYDVLKKYYNYQQLTVIPRMFKKIELIGKEYINVYEIDVENEREAFQMIAEMINRPEKRYRLPYKVEISDTDSIEKVASDLFEIIEKIAKEAKTADEIMRSILSDEDCLILNRALDVKSIGSFHSYEKEYYYDEQAVVAILEDDFEEEIAFAYKTRPRNLSLQNIVNSIKKAACFGFYKDSIEEIQLVMEDIRKDILSASKKKK